MTHEVGTGGGRFEHPLALACGRCHHFSCVSAQRGVAGCGCDTIEVAVLSATKDMARAAAAFPETSQHMKDLSANNYVAAYNAWAAVVQAEKDGAPAESLKGLRYTT